LPVLTGIAREVPVATVAQALPYAPDVGTGIAPLGGLPGEWWQEIKQAVASGYQRHKRFVPMATALQSCAHACERTPDLMCVKPPI